MAPNPRRASHITGLPCRAGVELSVSPAVNCSRSMSCNLKKLSQKQREIPFTMPSKDLEKQIAVQQVFCLCCFVPTSMMEKNVREWHQLGQHNWALNTSGKWDVLFSVAPAGSSGFSQIGMPSGSLNDNSKRSLANLRHCYRLLQHKQMFRSPKMIKWTGDIYVDILYWKSRHHMIVAWLVHLDPGVFFHHDHPVLHSFRASSGCVWIHLVHPWQCHGMMGWWDDPAVKSGIRRFHGDLLGSSIATGKIA